MAGWAPVVVFRVLSHFVVRGRTRVKTDGSEWFYGENVFLRKVDRFKVLRGRGERWPDVFLALLLLSLLSSGGPLGPDLPLLGLLGEGGFGGGECMVKPLV